MAHDVFISHASQDKPVADSICSGLEASGIRCWIAPRDVQPGRSFPGEITRAIQASKVMVLIFSAHSNNSEEVIREVQLAVSAHLHIIQFRIEDVVANDDLKYYLSTPHWLDALTPPLKNHLRQLVTSIKALLPVAAPEPSWTTPPTTISPPEPALVPQGLPLDEPAKPKSNRIVITAAIAGFVVVLLAASAIWAFINLSHRSGVSETVSISRAATATPAASETPAMSPPATAPTAPANVTTSTAAPSAAEAAASGPAVTEANKQESQNYIESAFSREKKSDFDGAMKDFDRAVELNPRNVRGYNARGTLKFRKGDYNGALADYLKAAEIMPRNPVTHNNIGKVYLHTGRINEAIDELNRSIAIESNIALPFANRGAAKLRKNDFKGASYDFNRALEIDSQNGPALEGRGSLEMIKGQWSEALSDLQRCCANESASDYAHLLLWITEIHFPNKGLADQHLADFMKQRPAPANADDPNGRIARFLLGQLPAERFLSPGKRLYEPEAELEMKKCRVWMFAGMKSVATSDVSFATGCFQNALATNQTEMFEYMLAQAELKRLGK